MNDQQGERSLEPPNPYIYRLVIVPEVRGWLHQLRRDDPDTLKHITAALTRLQERGPGLGRPTADRITGSKYAMKELRPRSGSRVSIRMLYVFDPQRQAVVLAAGNKAGNWTGWYDETIPIAEERYERHLKEMEEGRR
ncbi:type II toxin-antitoxin system RelE/ParE family toxin [Streptomyces xiangluensis]|uniref:Type II toxin-antitoxin system RelE/ParE family toxin n=1 Tax=Streptomyces xiangluensis TaxID=2665720 RepID=A0ABV8YZR3_9ACTN